MKNFNYTARDKAGALKKGSLTVVDRKVALLELKKLGFVPLSVTEGNGPKKACYLNLPRLLLAVAGIILVLATVVIMTTRKTPKQPVQNKAVVQAKNRVAKMPTKKMVTAMPDMEDPAHETTTSVPVQPPVQPTLGDTRVVTDADVDVAQPVQKKPIRGAQKRLAEALEKGLPVEPLFKHETESMLAFYVRPGEPVPPHPLPENIEEEARKALAENIVVTNEDTPEQEQEKELVAWMKEDMRKYLAKGGTAKEFFEVMQTRQEEEAKLFMEARSVLGDINREGNTDATMEAYKALNEALKEKGIVPLPLPGSLRRQMK